MEQLERSLTKGQIQLVSVGVLLPYVLYAAPVLKSVSGRYDPTGT